MRRRTAPLGKFDSSNTTNPSTSRLNADERLDAISFDSRQTSSLSISSFLISKIIVRRLFGIILIMPFITDSRFNKIDRSLQRRFKLFSNLSGTQTFAVEILQFQIQLESARRH